MINMDPRRHIQYGSKQHFSKQQDILQSQSGKSDRMIRNKQKRQRSKEGTGSDCGKSIDRASPIKLDSEVLGKAKSPNLPEQISEMNEVSSPNRASKSKTKDSHISSPLGSHAKRESLYQNQNQSKLSGMAQIDRATHSGREKHEKDRDSLVHITGSKQTDRTRIVAEESQIQNVNELEFVDKIKSIDFQGLQINQIQPKERDVQSRGNIKSRANQSSKNQKPQSQNNNDIVSAVTQTRNVPVHEELDYTLRKETEPMLNSTNYQSRINQNNPKDAELLVSQTMDHSQPGKSSKSLVTPTPTIIRETKQEDLLKNSKDTDEAQRQTQNLQIYDDNYTGRLSNSKTSQGYHMTSPTSAVLIKKKVQKSQRTSQQGDDDLNNRDSQLPAIMYTTQYGSNREKSVSQMTQEQQITYIRKSVFDDENHLNRMLRQRPPKYLGRGEFGTRYKFPKKTMANNVTNSNGNNDEKVIGRNHALQFSFQKESNKSNAIDKLKQSSNLRQSPIPELQITGSNRLEAVGSKPHTAFSSKLNELSFNSRNKKNIKTIDLKQQQNQSLQNLKKIRTETEPQSTLRKEHNKKSLSQFDAIRPISIDVQPEMDQPSMLLQRRGSPNRAGDSRKSSACKNFNNFNIDPWEPKMMCIPVQQFAEQSPSSLPPTTLNSRSKLHHGAHAPSNEVAAWRNAGSIQYHQSNKQASQHDPTELRRRENAPMPAKASGKNPADLYNEQHNKKNKQRRRTNPFRAVHKGLVASRNAGRSIQKLCNQLGSFANRDDVQVTVHSPRIQGANIKIVANSINSSQENKFANLNFKCLQSSQSPLYSLNNSNDAIQRHELEQNCEGYASIRSQNFSFNAQPLILGHKDGQLVLQTQNSDPSHDQWKNHAWAAQQFGWPDQRFADFSTIDQRETVNATAPNEIGAQGQKMYSAQASTPRVMAASPKKHRQRDSAITNNRQEMNPSLRSEKRSSIVNFQSAGSRKLFTLPTTAVEDLRKEELLLQKKQEINFGLVSKQVSLKEQLGNKRKGGGLVIKQMNNTANQAVGLDALSNSYTNDESLDKVASQRESRNQDAARRKKSEFVTEEREIER